MGTFAVCCMLFKLSIFLLYHTVATASPTKISSEIRSKIDKGENVNVVVSFVGGVKPAIDKALALRLGDKKLQNEAIIKESKKHMSDTQAGVLQLLSTRTGSGHEYFKQYWLGNKLFVKEASASTVNAIANDPKVLTVNLEPIATLPMERSDPRPRYAGYQPPNITWGMKRMQVLEAWDELGGNRGEGVVVGIIDTGIRHTHEALRDNFAGGIDYRWFDAATNGSKTEPYDAAPETGHGTNVASIIIAHKNLGIAPQSKLIVCSASDGKGLPGKALLDCLQWMACPTLPDGSSPDCTKAPAIVSNSWVLPRGEHDLDAPVYHLRELGIIPIGAVGNSGRSCNKTRPPGDLPYVIGVGSADIDGVLHQISSAGWASDGGIKPDIVAPGEYLPVATSESDSEYWSVQGTSISTPHVAALSALLKVRNPNLTYDELYSLLTQNTDPVKFLYVPDYINYICTNGTNSYQTPNIFWGYGQVNALKAVKAQSLLLKNK